MMTWLARLLGRLFKRHPPPDSAGLRRVEERTEEILTRLEALDVDVEVVRREEP